MNAASLLVFFNNKYKLKIPNKKMYEIAAEIGSDVILGLKIKNTFINNINKVSKQIIPISHKIVI